MLTVLADGDARAEFALGLDEICRVGARRMLAVALEAEADAYVAAFTDDLDEDGHRLVTHNGHARKRTIATGAGPIEITAPRVNDRRRDEVSGERQAFTSSIIAPWCRKSPKVSEVAAAHVPARDELGRLRSRARGVLRLGGRSLAIGGDEVDQTVAGRAEGLQPHPRQALPVDFGQQ